MSVARCETLPRDEDFAGTLYVSPPLTHTLLKLKTFLEQRGRAADEPYPATLAIRVGPGEVHDLLGSLPGLLSRLELQDTRALLIRGATPDAPAGLSRVESLGSLIARAGAGWLVEMLAANRLISHFQPVVPARAPGEVYGYEALIRGLAPDGELVGAGSIMALARAADLLYQVDGAARVAAVAGAARHRLAGALFVNFVPAAIYDPEYSLSTTSFAIRSAGLKPGEVVFEVSGTEEAPDLPHLVKILAHLRSAGHKIALDDLGAGFSSLRLLRELEPDFIKLDVGLIRGVNKDPYRAAVAAKLLELARTLGVQSVAEGVSTKGEFDWVRENGADLVQGFLFAEPAAPPLAPATPG